MTWTVTTLFKTDLAETNDIADLLTGSTLAFLTSGDSDLVECALTSATGGGDGTVDVLYDATAAAADGTAAHAEIRKSGGSVYLSTDDVGTSGNDIVFDDNVFATGGTVTPGTLTLDLTSLTAT